MEQKNDWKKEFVMLDGKVCVRREGMGEHDYRPVEIRDIESLLSRQEGEIIGELKEANELLRSAYQIAARRGEATNWSAFIGRLGEALERQMKFLAALKEPGEETKK